MRPSRLMKHRVSIYRPTVSTTNGEDSRTFASNPTHKNVPAFVQPAVSEVVELYRGRNERCSASVFLVSQTVFAAIAEQDRIVFDGHNYRVIGKQDLCHLGRVFRVDVVEEI